MLKNPDVSKIVPVALALALVAGGGALSARGGTGDDSPAQPAEKATAKSDAASASSCTAPAAWFPHDQTPKPNDDADFTTNCDFHLWSWQTFLWLTQTAPDGQLRFEHFARPSILNVSEGSELPPFDQHAESSTLKLMPRVAKSDDPTMLGAIQQAGSLGLLVDQDRRAVYYSQYLNRTFYEFVRKHGFQDPEKLANASPTLDFPVGAQELKAAWKIVEDGEDTSGFYTREAEIALLVEKDGSVVVDPSRTEKVTVALVGLHVAGVVKGHPEFIWATFEHEDNAPTLTDEQLGKYLNTEMSKKQQRKFEKSPVSPKSYTFYEAGTPFIRSNQNNAGTVKLVDAHAQTLKPVTDAFIQYAQGGGSKTNRSNVRALNASVASQLKDPVFGSYYEGGAIWLGQKNALKPNETQQNLIVGSTDLSNVTMETFTQKVKSQRNCFGCHNTLQRFPEQQGTGVDPLPGLNLNVSHILVNHYFQASQAQAGDEDDAGTGR